MPAALIGLVAKRGHDALLRRLLSLNGARHVPPVLRYSAPMPAAAAARVVPRASRGTEQALLGCLDALLEASILAGDHEATCVLIPSYDPHDDAWHLSCSACALAPFTALCIARGDEAAMRSLRNAGAAEWSRDHGDHITLSHLVRGAEDAYVPRRRNTNRDQLSPPSYGAAGASTAASERASSRRGGDVAQPSPLCQAAARVPASVVRTPEPTAPATCEADAQTVLKDGSAVKEPQCASASGDAERTSADVHVEGPTRPGGESEGQVEGAADVLRKYGIGSAGANDPPPSHVESAADVLSIYGIDTAGGGEYHGKSTAAPPSHFESAADVLRRYGIGEVGTAGSSADAFLRTIPLGNSCKAGSPTRRTSAHGSRNHPVALRDALHSMEEAMLTMAVSSGVELESATSPRRHSASGGSPDQGPLVCKSPSQRSLSEALAEMQLAMSEFCATSPVVSPKAIDPFEGVSLSGSLLGLELSLKQLSSSFASRLPPSPPKSDAKLALGDDSARLAKLSFGASAAEELLAAAARAAEALGGPHTLAGFQAAKSQARTRAMGVSVPTERRERIGDNTVPRIAIPRPVVLLQPRTPPPHRMPQPTTDRGAGAACPSPTDDELWRTLLAEMPAHAWRARGGDPRAVRQSSAQPYRTLAPPPLPPPPLPPSLDYEDPPTPTWVVPEQTWRKQRPLYLGRTPTSPYEPSVSSLDAEKLRAKLADASVAAEPYRVRLDHQTFAYAPGHHTKLAARATAAAIRANQQAMHALALS